MLERLTRQQVYEAGAGDARWVYSRELPWDQCLSEMEGKTRLSWPGK